MALIRRLVAGGLLSLAACAPSLGTPDDAPSPVPACTDAYAAMARGASDDARLAIAVYAVRKAEMAGDSPTPLAPEIVDGLERTLAEADEDTTRAANIRRRYVAAPAVLASWARRYSLSLRPVDVRVSAMEIYTRYRSQFAEEEWGYVASVTASGEIRALTHADSAGTVIIVNPLAPYPGYLQTAVHEYVHVLQHLGFPSGAFAAADGLSRLAATEGIAEYVSRRALLEQQRSTVPADSIDPYLFRSFIADARSIAGDRSHFSTLYLAAYALAPAYIALAATRSGPEQAIERYATQPACF